MIAADSVTRYYKRSDTTMRDNPWPAYIPRWYARTHNLFYSISQIFATLNMLFRNNERVFLSLIPIQTAPFCMTLVKKGIINQAGWHFWYTVALLINYWYSLAYKENGVAIKYMALFCIVSRFGFRMNKYFMWLCVLGWVGLGGVL
jgi:hypothetical protein